MDARALIDAYLAGEDPLGSSESGDLDESWILIRRRQPHRASYRRSRIGKATYRRHRETYKRAMKKWQRNPRAKSFYKRLARWNARHESILPRSGSLLEAQKAAASLIELFRLVVEEFSQLPEFSELVERVGHLADEMEIVFTGLVEDSDAWQDYFQIYADYDQERRDLLEILI